MVFQLRRADGSIDAFSSGTFVAADGSTTALGPGDFTLEVTGHVAQPALGRRVPGGVAAARPEGASLTLTITPHLADQEMQVSYVYWEGAVGVEGTANGAAGDAGTGTWS